MIPSVEQVRQTPDASFRAFRRIAKAYRFGWHHHAEFELTWIERGRGRRFLGDHTTAYGDGDFVLIGPWLPHTWASDDRRPQRAVVVQFDGQWLASLVASATELRPVGRLLERARRGLRFAPPRPADAALLKQLCASNARGGPRVVALLSLLDRLAHASASPLASAAYAADPPPADPRVAGALRYAGESFVEGVTQAEAARRAKLTPEAFSRLFRRHTGRTFQRHVHDLRVGRACRMLQEGGRSITGVCFDAGFGNVSNFNRVFRRLIGTTPRTYRDRFGDASTR